MNWPRKDIPCVAYATPSSCNASPEWLPSCPKAGEEQTKETIHNTVKLSAGQRFPADHSELTTGAPSYQHYLFITTGAP